MRLTILDLISVVMDEPIRRLDFAVSLHFSRSLDQTALEAGATSARLQYPSTSAVLDGKHWRITPDANVEISSRTVMTTEAHDAATEFVNASWDIRRTPPVRQLALWLPDTNRTTLVTRFHHAACDGLGGLLWLQHQLEVAAGASAPLRVAAAYAPPVLLRHPDPVSKSMFAFRGPADRLYLDSRSASGRRNWRTLPLDMAPPQAVAARAGGFTYNDLLVACTLETFCLWNASRNLEREPEVGVWLPINVRHEPLHGFGNGSSRIRVYNRHSSSAGLHEKCRAVRRQIEWSRENGEWAVPELLGLTRLPMRVLRPLLRAYFNRPWVDMATGAFSHIERSPLDAQAFADVTSVELIGVLDNRHALGLYAMSRAGTTHLTFVHDPAQLDESAVSRLTAIYQEQLASAVAKGSR